MKKDLQNYYTNVADQSKAQLNSLRRIIQNELPQADEVISYGIPTFKVNGRSIVGIGGWNDFVSLYPFGNDTIREFTTELKNFTTSKGAIQLPLDQPLPITLIRKIVQYKLKSIT